MLWLSGEYFKGNERGMETEKLEGFELMMNSWLLAEEDKQINKC